VLAKFSGVPTKDEGNKKISLLQMEISMCNVYGDGLFGLPEGLKDCAIFPRRLNYKPKLECVQL